MLDNDKHNKFIIKVARSIADKSTLERMSKVELDALNSLLDGEASEHERDILDKASDRLVSQYSSEVLDNG
tara:strand:+ start:1034 stop:1246 length:213 start_codon:yes stop_codon:yes gene_type:complete